MGERDEEEAMPWDKIEATDYKIWNKQTNFDAAITNSKKRIAESQAMQLINENAKWLDERNKENKYSLNIDKFKLEQKKLEEMSKKFKILSDYDNKLIFRSLSNEELLIKTDAALKEKRERWHESLSKDIYMEEAIHVLDDLQSDAQKSPFSGKVVDKQPKIKS